MATGNDLIFDTSGLNALADDPEYRAIAQSFGSGFRVRISETNISEIVATKDPARREQFLKLCQFLVHAGEGIKPYHSILEEMSRGHSSNPKDFDWRNIDIRFPELETEIARREFRRDADLATEVREHNRLVNKQFEELYKDAREKFEPVFRQADAERIAPAKVIDYIQAKGSPFWRLVSDIYERPTSRSLNEDEAREFIERCPPAKAIFFHA